MRPALAAIAIGLVILLSYPVSCIVFPLRDCRCCDGAGVHRSKNDRKNSRRCWWCKGSGKRWRIGRRIWNRIRARQREAR